MKRSIRHLPDKKQTELKEIVSFITEKNAIEMIILFGSHARGDWVEDKYQENGTTYEYKSDYDLLVVVEDEEKASRHKPAKRLRHKIRRNVDTDTPLNIIYHGIDYLNSEIENGNYFFTDILKEGIRLYHSKRYILSKPKQLNKQDRINKAQLYFDKWFESANDFYFQFDYALFNQKWNNAVFQLHQATERYYMTSLLVFTDYKPKTHDLEELDNRTSKLDARFKTVFPRQTEEEERLFDLLKKAYIDSRYKLGYEIKKEELEYLSERIKNLQELTNRLCLEKLAQIKRNNAT